jgi:hypothetical protein
MDESTNGETILVTPLTDETISRHCMSLLLLIGLGMSALLSRDKIDKKSLQEDLNLMNYQLGEYLRVKFPE